MKRKEYECNKNRVCSFRGCKGLAQARGLCGAHYQQQRKGKTLVPLQTQYHGLSEKDRFFKWVVCTEACWQWQGSFKISPNRPKKNWHGQWRNKEGKVELTHRASWRLHNGKIPKGMFVLHKCDNPLCVNPEHLYIGTQFNNMKDMVDRGRMNPVSLLNLNH